jgi:tetratricopeptide (TPR) repeat protein
LTTRGKPIADLVAALLLLSVPLLWGFEPFRTGNDSVEQGNAALKAGKTEQALEHYERAAKELPSSPGVHYNRGIALRRLERLDEAGEALTKGTTATDRGLKAKSFYNLGNVLYEQEKYKDAAAAFKRSLQLQPDHVPSKWNLELALRRIQEEKKQQKNQQKDQQKDQQKNQQKNQQKQDSTDEQQQKKKGQQDAGKNKQPKPDDKQKKRREEQKPGDRGKKQDPQPGPRDRPKPSPSKQQRDAVLDALDRNDRNLQRRRARIRGRGRRKPAKDW